VYVHISEVQKSGFDCLIEGARVTFDIVNNRGKQAAENLRVNR
jgi:CspA family cold shock protein